MTPTPQHHIAIVEDDPEIRIMTAAMLEEEQYRVTPCASGKDLDQVMARDRPDLVILDLMLPGEDGLSICRRLVAAGGVRVLMVTARGSDVDRIIGLELGADDYLPKPFNPRELLARVRAVLRRGVTQPMSQGAAGDAIEFAGYRLDMGARRLSRMADDTDIILSSGEYDLLAFLLRHPGRVLTRDQVLDGTRGRNATPFDRSVDVLVSKLRRKLGDDAGQAQMIKTVRGGGYVFAAPVRRNGT